MLPTEHFALPAASEPTRPLPDKCLHLIQLLKWWQPLPLGKEGLRSEPLPVASTVPPYTSPSLPSPTQRERHKQLFILSQQRQREGDVVNSYWAGSFAFIANSRRLGEKLASSKPRASSGAPRPPRPRPPRRGDRTSQARAAGRAAPTGGGQDGGRGRPVAGKMPLASKEQRCSRHCAERLPPRATSGEYRPISRAPRAQAGSALQPLPPPNPNSAGGRGSPAQLSPYPNFLQQTSQPVLPDEGETKAPWDDQQPRGARGRHSPPRAALGAGALRLGAQRRPSAAPQPRLLPGRGPLMVGGACPQKSPRADLPCAGWLRRPRLRRRLRLLQLPPRPRQLQARL